LRGFTFTLTAITDDFVDVCNFMEFSKLRLPNPLSVCQAVINRELVHRFSVSTFMLDAIPVCLDIWHASPLRSLATLLSCLQRISTLEGDNLNNVPSGRARHIWNLSWPEETESCFGDSPSSAIDGRPRDCTAQHWDYLLPFLAAHLSPLFPRCLLGKCLSSRADSGKSQ
jgi:hypothetical protein